MQIMTIFGHDVKGIIPDQTTVYAEFYQSLRSLLPQTKVKFCIYRGFGYSYSSMTSYFKMNDYCKFYAKSFIVMTDIMGIIGAAGLCCILPLKYFII